MSLVKVHEFEKLRLRLAQLTALRRTWLEVRRGIELDQGDPRRAEKLHDADRTIRSLSVEAGLVMEELAEYAQE